MSAPSLTRTARQRFEVRGTVQGVGFRPFVYRQAMAHRLVGWVANRSGDVEIEVEGAPEDLDAFARDLIALAPPLARVEALAVADLPLSGGTHFEIRVSEARPGEAQPVPPDTAPCDDCRRELADPADRRYRYPFTNCTNCGPRFTIIEALPYDRPRTTMRDFPLCADCAREYHDPADRRFHAQPIACPACGPRLEFRGAPTTAGDDRGRVAVGAEPPSAPGPVMGDMALPDAVALLRAGGSLAIKGLGGFQLACDAGDDSAVRRLRERKRRDAKPFAVMFPDLGSVRRAAMVSAAEADLLSAPERPIVLLAQRGTLAPAVAPGLAEVGAMLPSTPLHELLLREFGGPLVMTSGNLSEEPICAANEEALTRLDGIADGFLLHDRPIASRYDDSVARVVAGEVVLTRRARGHAPAPLALPFAAERPILACGAHLKSTFCLLKGRHAFLSQHIGDLENLETLEHFKATLTLYERLFEVRPELIAHDLHPEYLSTKLAMEEVARDAAMREHVPVQHHHAHIVSCLAEHGLRGPTIGVAYDGLGYGSDGHLWGGEVLLADWRSFERRAHLREAPLPGGEGAIRKPYRMALGYLLDWFPSDLDTFAPFVEPIAAAELAVLRTQVQRGLNTPPTSSCGRLFDAVSALLGICSVARYEGQAAMELQARADPAAEGTYPYELAERGGMWVVDPAPLLGALWHDHQTGVAVSTIAMRFHRAVADATAEICRRLAAETGVRLVALSGGVFQNTLLLRELVHRLTRAGLEPIFNQRVPTNDGGIAFGQAVIAHSMRGGGADG